MREKGETPREMEGRGGTQGCRGGMMGGLDQLNGGTSAGRGSVGKTEKNKGDMKENQGRKDMGKKEETRTPRITYGYGRKDAKGRQEGGE